MQFTPAEGLIAAAEVMRHEDVNRDINEERINALKHEIYQTAKDNGEDPVVLAGKVVQHVVDFRDAMSGEAYDA